MKTFWNKIATAVLVLTLCIAQPGNAVIAMTEQQLDQVYLCDEGDRLAEGEFAQVLELLGNASDEIGMNIGIWLGSEPMGASDTVAFCDNTYDEQFGVDTDGVFLYLDLSGEADLYDYISTSGKGQFYYANFEDDDRIREIFDDMNPYLSRGKEDVVHAISVFCDDLKFYAQAGAPDETYYVYDSNNEVYLILEDNEVRRVSELPDDYTATVSWSMIVCISLLIGVITGGLTLLVICRAYRFKEAGSMRHYLENGKVQFTIRQDLFLRQYRSRTKISSDSSSHGGGFSHSSASGGSHGGGGNHR